MKKIQPRKLRLGIVGTGARGYSLTVPLRTPEFAGRAEVVAVFDNDPKKTEFARATFGSAIRECASLAELLAAELDLVLITTPQFAHTATAEAALDAGHNVFLEKPMARNTAECRRIIEAEKRNPGTLFMGFNLRHHPTCLVMHDQLKRVGRVQQQVCTDFYSGGYTYFRRWHRLCANSGGLTVEKGCHSIDLLNWFAVDTPVRVAAFGGRDRFNPDPEATQYCTECGKKERCVYYMDVKKAAENTKLNTGIDQVVVDGGKKLDLCPFNSDKDTFDNTNIIIEYANGCRATLIECFTSSVRATSGRQFVLNGFDGQLWAGLVDRSVRFFPNQPGCAAVPPEIVPVPENSGSHGGADPRMLDYVLGSLESGTPNSEMLAKDGFYAVAVAEAAEKSIRERREVEVEQL